jgi:hypothetical protein
MRVEGASYTCGWYLTSGVRTGVLANQEKWEIQPQPSKDNEKVKQRL